MSQPLNSFLSSNYDFAATTGVGNSEQGLSARVLLAAHHKNLQAQLDSDVRREWIQQAKPLIQAPEEMQVLTGLETWFVLPIPISFNNATDQIPPSPS